MSIVPRVSFVFVALFVQALATTMSQSNPQSQPEEAAQPARPAVDSRIQQVEHLLLSGELLLSLGHEVRNALLGMLGNVQLLHYEALPVPAREIVDQVLSAGQHLQALVEAMLGLGAAGKEARCDVGVVLPNVVRLVQPLARDNHARLEVVPPVHVEVELPPHALQQIILNLLLNSLHAVGGQNGRIWLTTEEQDDHVLIKVRDNGPGIPDDVRAKIFEPFFSTKPANVGTGLGLAIARNLARQARGDLDVVDARPGHTTFALTLPRAAPQAS